MGRIITGQVIASTSMDAHGEALGEETIRNLFQQLADLSISFRNHVTSHAPVCRGFNKRLEQLPKDGLAIVVDLEVLDEDAFKQAGGFSIAFTNRTIRFGSDPAIRVLVNPRQFAFEEMARDIGRLLPPGQSIDVTERIEKAAVLEVAIIIVAFAAGAAAKGFFSKVGGELFDYLKKRRSLNTTAEPAIHLQIKCEIRSRPVVVLLVADPAVSPLELARVDVEAVSSHMEAVARDVEIQRAVGVIRPGPVVEVSFLVGADGTAIRK